MIVTFASVTINKQLIASILINVTIIFNSARYRVAAHMRSNLGPLFWDYIQQHLRTWLPCVHTHLCVYNLYTRLCVYNRTHVPPYALCCRPSVGLAMHQWACCICMLWYTQQWSYCKLSKLFSFCLVL